MKAKLDEILFTLLLISIPLEISKALFPPYSLSTEGGTSLSFSRIFILVFIGNFLWRLIRRKIDLSRLFREKQLIWIAPLALTVVLSPLSAYHPVQAVKEVVRFFLMLLLFISVYDFALRKATLGINRITVTMTIMGCLTGLFGIVQYTTHSFLWAASAENSLFRINSTFIDPNIFARYLVVSLMFTIGLLMVGRDQGIKSKGLLIGSVVIQLISLGLTFSRQGWLMLILCVICYAVILQDKRLNLFLLMTAGVCTLGLLYPTILARVMSLSAGASILGERIYLTKAAFVMFTQHPFLGVGIGNFSDYLTNKLAYLGGPGGITVSRPHTYVLTILAELGLLGLFSLAIWWIGIVIWLLRVLKQPPLHQRVAATTLTLGILGIFIGAQLEGRFFEEPLVWVFAGVLLAIAAVHPDKYQTAHNK